MQEPVREPGREIAWQQILPAGAPVPRPAFDDEDDEEGAGRASSSSSSSSIRNQRGREGALARRLASRLEMTGAAYFMGMLRRAAENRGRLDLVAPGESPEAAEPEHPYDRDCGCPECDRKLRGALARQREGAAYRDSLERRRALG